MPEFGLGERFDYAELAALIALAPSWSNAATMTRGLDEWSPPSTPKSAASTTNSTWATARPSNSSMAGTRSTVWAPSSSCSGTSTGQRATSKPVQPQPFSIGTADHAAVFGQLPS